MPLPHFQTLYLLNPDIQSMLSTVPPSLTELGRLHLTPFEVRQIQKQEKKELRQMAFGIVKKSELPVTQVGKQASTTPAIGVANNGRIMLNGFINKAWAATAVSKVAVLYDPETRKVAIIGLKAEAKIKGIDEQDYFIPTVGKPAASTGKGGGDYSLAASGFFKDKYDYKSAGNQTFVAKAEEIMKMAAFTFILPSETPKPKPVVTRKKKDGANGTGVVGVTPAVVTQQELLLNGAAPADPDELVIE